jgi:hypothetical protein
VDQVVATCRFLGQDPELKSPYIDYAINNLGVHRKSKSQAGSDGPPERAKMPSRLNIPSRLFDAS